MADYRFDRRTTLSPEEETGLWKEWKVNNNVSARDLIARCHLRHVETIVHILSKSKEDFDTLVAEGNYGLIQALEKFEPERGLRFITYAVHWIRAAISHYIQSSRTIIGKPLVGSGIVYKLRRERVKATNLVGNDPEAIELIVARKMGLPLEKVQDQLRRLDAYNVSLDVNIYLNGQQKLADTLEADTLLPDVAIYQQRNTAARKAIIDAALSTLMPREKFIAEKRLMDDDPLPLAEIGKHFGVSRERARQLEMRTVKKLKQALHGFATQERT